MHPVRQLRPELRLHVGVRELLSRIGRGLAGRLAPACMLFALATSGCGDDEEEEPPKGDCFSYDGWDGMTPTVEANVVLFGDLPNMGVIRRACATANCHGSELDADADLYLGPPLRDTAKQPLAITPTDIATVLANLGDVDSKTAPSIKRIVPYEPRNSFLMMKVDGCLDAVKAECTSRQPGYKGEHPCGDFMPQTGILLEAPERDLIRRWIAQGANAG